jgi:hypothetical protein
MPARESPWDRLATLEEEPGRRERQVAAGFGFYFRVRRQTHPAPCRTKCKSSGGKYPEIEVETQEIVSRNEAALAGPSFARAGGELFIRGEIVQLLLCLIPKSLAILNPQANSCSS